MPDIPAVPRTPGAHGVFECLPTLDESGDIESQMRAFVSQIEDDCRNHRGAVLVAYLEQLVQVQADSTWRDNQKGRIAQIVDELVKNIKDTAVARVAKRFALVQVALELAHGWGLLPFPIEQASWATRTLFFDWFDARGGAGSVEVKQCLTRIEAEFARHQHSDRIYHIDNPPLDNDGKRKPVRDLLAYYKAPSDREAEYWIPTTVFNEFAKGVDRDLLTKELQSRGWMLGPDSNGKNAHAKRVDNQVKRLYIFRQFWDVEIENKTENRNGFDSLFGVTSVTVLQEVQNQDREGTPGVTPTPHFCNTRGSEVLQNDDSIGVSASDTSVSDGWEGIE
jgi:hypothetical protein